MGRKNVMWVIIFTVVILMCIAYMFIFSKKDNAKSADIYFGDELVKHIDDIATDEQQSYELKTEYGYNKICWQSGEIWIEESDCKNQICVNTGKLSSENGSIICAPHKVVITVSSQE